MNKFTIFNGLLVLVISSVLSGCSSFMQTQPGAEKVTITKGPIPTNCKLKGQVSVTDNANDMTTPYQHTRLMAEEYSKLRNKAQQIGANTVLLSPSSGMSDKKHWNTKTQHRDQAAHVYSGNAYWCPAH